MSENTGIDVAQEQEDELVKKKGDTSVVWNWFGFKISDPDQKNCLMQVVSSCCEVPPLRGHSGKCCDMSQGSTKARNSQHAGIPGTEFVKKVL